MLNSYFYKTDVKVFHTYLPIISSGSRQWQFRECMFIGSVTLLRETLDRRTEYFEMIKHEFLYEKTKH